MEQTRFMGDKILNFFKHLSVTKRVLLGIITLLVIGYLLSSPATVSCSLLYRCDRQKWRVIRSTYRFRRSMEISSTKDDTRENQAMPHYFRRQEFLLSLGSRPVIHRESYLSESKKQTYRQRRQYPHNADDPPGPQ